ncbi:hypothetical protein V2J09_015359 [Rumex salicifolius]
MASDLIKKRACSSSGVVYVIFLLLIFITFMASSFTWLQNHHRYTPQDHDHPKKLMLETVTDPDPTPHPPSSVPVGISCDRTHFRYDLCSINDQVILDPTKATLYSIGPTSNLEKIKPYPRKWENIMAIIRDVKLRTDPVGPRCEVHHSSPALVFSAGGLTGNFFHDFNDGFLPLYITLNSLSMADRDVILVVDNARDWWVNKYADIIRAFTKHPIINLENENLTHCFPRASVGLISHGFMTVDQKALPGPTSLAHFHSFIRNAFYSHEVRPSPPNPKWGRKPKLVWLARAGSVGRVILNQEKARAVAEDIGFKVITYNPTMTFPMRKAHELIDESHAMIGVHGAAMMHMLFLRKGSVAVQVVPLGLDWVGKACFGQAAMDVGLEYMEYKVGYNESSLSRKYKEGDPILKSTNELLEEKGWIQEFMDIFLKEQDVRLDLDRFRVHMEMVYKKAKHFMDMHG